MFFRQFQNSVNHFAESFKGFILQIKHGIFRGVTEFGQKSFGAKFFAAETDDHYLTAEIWILGDVPNRADRHDCPWRINSDSATVAMIQTNDIINMGIKRKKFMFYFLTNKISHPGHALDTRRNS